MPPSEQIVMINVKQVGKVSKKYETTEWFFSYSNTNFVKTY